MFICFRSHANPTLPLSDAYSRPCVEIDWGGVAFLLHAGCIGNASKQGAPVHRNTTMGGRYETCSQNFSLITGTKETVKTDHDNIVYEFGSEKKHAGMRSVEQCKFNPYPAKVENMVNS